MIVRQLDANGDFQLGRLLANSPEAVAQVVQSRLALWRGEWFLDVTDGTPYTQDILGHRTNYDLEIQTRILGTPGVLEIVNYSSSVDNRALSVRAVINTLYGQVSVATPQ